MRAKRIVFLLVVAAMVSVLITVGSLLHSQAVEYSDYRTDRFGFPYYWIEHVTMTFAGRTDYWNIATSNLAMNIVLFFIISFGALCLTLVWKSKRS
jgi:hypothetical protein